jgi:hypothetical protein
MSAIASIRRDAEAKNAPTSGRLLFLDLGAGRILSANPDGSDLKTIITKAGSCPSLVPFGVHCLLIGYLIFKSSFPLPNSGRADDSC